MDKIHIILGDIDWFITPKSCTVMLRWMWWLWEWYTGWLTIVFLMPMVEEIILIQSIVDHIILHVTHPILCMRLQWIFWLNLRRILNSSILWVSLRVVWCTHIHIFEVGETIVGGTRFLETLNDRNNLCETRAHFGNYLQHWGNQIVKSIGVKGPHFVEVHRNSLQIRLLDLGIIYIDFLQKTQLQHNYP